MARVITFSRNFPAYHPKAGAPTLFAAKYRDGAKRHTIRAGNRFEAGDMFSPRQWKDKPYRSKQMLLGPDRRITKVYSFEIMDGLFWIGDKIWDVRDIGDVARNDGLSTDDFLAWFKFPAPFVGQIICWDETISY